MSSEPNKPDDLELEDFLHGASRIGAAYREAARQDSAPRELDAAILAMAREAVAKPVRRRPRWIQPMAVAATLALSLGVLLNIWRDPAARRQLASEAEPMRDEQAVPTREPPAAVAVPAAEIAAEPEPKNTASTTADKAFFPLEPVAESVPELRKKERVVEPLAPPPPPAPLAKSGDALGAAAVDAAPVQSAPAPAQNRVLESVEQQRPAAAALEREEKQKSMRREVPPVERDGAAAAAASGAPAVAAAQSRPDDASGEDRIVHSTPEQWIDSVRARIGQGDTAGARAALKAFREVYPDFALPEDLKRFDDAPPR